MMILYRCCGDFKDPGTCDICGKKRVLVVDEQLLSNILASTQPKNALSNISNHLENFLYRNWSYEYRRLFVEILEEMKLALPIEYQPRIDGIITETIQKLKEIRPKYQIDFEVSKKDLDSIRTVMDTLIGEKSQYDLYPKANFSLRVKKINNLTGINAILNCFNILSMKSGGKINE
jgi:hypothetical protein